MQVPQNQKTPPLGVVFDSSLDGDVDQVLALAMLYGFEGRRQIRMASLSTSRFDLRLARFLDLIARFYGGGQVTIGMSAAGTPATAVPAPLDAALLKTGADGNVLYARAVTGLNDTADPVALMRNGLSAQADRNAVVIIAGRPTNALALLANPDGRAWAAKKPRALVIAGGRFDDPGGTAGADPAITAEVAGFRTLLADWPTPIVMAGAELNDALPFPGRGIDEGMAWAPNHPVADVYRAARPMPYDAPSRALAAVLHAISPDERWLDVSEPGTIIIGDDGRTRFTPSPAGRHRYLIARTDQRDRVVQKYVEMVTAQPPPRPGRGRPAAGAGAVATLAGVLLAAWLAPGLSTNVSGQAGEFETVVRPVLTETCARCHNATMVAGGLDVGALATPASFAAQRGTWEKVLRRLRVGDMPPAGTPRPPRAQLEAMTASIERAFERLDASTPADPGRVTARRLNRQEYANTIRDLLGVRFRADRSFPADDSGDGFDNLADVLTVSPLLMERYLAAAERIAAWALSTEIPAKPIEIDYRARDRKIRRVDRSTIEVEHRVEFAGDYTVRIGLPGERPAVDGMDAAPVMLGLWMDGTRLASKTVQTKPSGLVYFDPYSEEELRVYLPEGDHVFRAAFIDDPFVAGLTNAEAYDRRKNKFLDSLVFVGPSRSTTEKDTRRRILTCDPASGRACVDRILTSLAGRAYRRPPSRAEIDALRRLVDQSVRSGRTAEQGIQLALQALLVSPNFLFRIERDPNPRDPRLVHEVTPFELASRVSYFLWSSMPDDELLALAESGRLREPAVLAAQVDRLLSDPRAAAFATTFAGQWLETRNLDIVTPDPDLFKEFDADLREAMKAETSLFFEHVVRGNRPVSDFLTADYTFLNERLATHYGIAGVRGAAMRQVALTTDRRGGILSQGAVLTVSSYPTRTSPVIRGKYVLQNILGMPPEPPPGDIPPLEDSLAAGRSPREQLERHRANPACAACHRNMDPLGFGLENYDAIGRWRDTEGAFPVDAAGTLPDGRPFTTPGEMRTLLVSQLPQFSRTLTEKLMTYALGRSLQPYDRRAVEGIQRALAADGYRMRTLIHQVVGSLPFQARRGEGVEEKVSGGR